MADAPKVCIDQLRFSDVNHVFNMIMRASYDGHFNPIYLEPRYMAGLGMQLFCLLSGWLRLPGGEWQRARTTVLRADDLVLGFLILLHRSDYDEIYMTAVDEDCRGTGMGKMLIQESILALKTERPLHAACLPASEAMQHILASLGFQARPLDNMTEFWRHAVPALRPEPGVMGTLKTKEA